MNESSVFIDVGKPIVLRVGLLGDEYWDWVHSPVTGQPVFFGHPVLENISKTPWWAVPIIWLPLFVFVCWQALTVYDARPWLLICNVLGGYLCWQLVEYLIHRLVFHCQLNTYWGITLHFLFHGCHHKFPMDGLRLVFPPVPASFVIFGVHRLLFAVLSAQTAACWFAGMLLGYVVYDCTHYFLHHSGPLPWPFLKGLRQRHMHHHFKDHSVGYGISSSTWDALLQTSVH